MIFFFQPPLRTKDAEKMLQPARGDQNIFAALAMGFMADSQPDTNNTSESVKAETPLVGKMEDNTEISKDKTEKKLDAVINKPNNSDKITESDAKVGRLGADVKTDSGTKVESELESVFVDIEGDTEGNSGIKGLRKSGVEQTKGEKSDKKDGSVSEFDDSRKKRHDSDSKRSHHHHRRQSHDHRRGSVADDHKDSSSHSQRRDSKDRRESSDSRRHSKDSERERHRSSTSSKSGKDRDRHDRRSSDSRDKERRDSVKDGSKDGKRRDEKDAKSGSSKDSGNDKNAKGTIGAVVKKVMKPGVKVKTKKLKKAEDLAVDSSMIDLFKPDNMPPPSQTEVKKETKEIVEPQSDKIVEKPKTSRVKFMDDDDTKKEADKGVEMINLNTELPDIKAVATKTIEDKEVDTDHKKSVETDMKKDSTEKSEITESVSALKSDDVKVEGKREESENIDVDVTTVSEPMEVEESVGKAETGGIEQIEKVKDDITVDEKKDDVSSVKKEDGSDMTTEIRERENSTEQTDVKVNTDKTDLDQPKIEVKKSETVVKVTYKDTEKPEEIKTVVTPKAEKKDKKPLRMSDFFSERRLKINDPKPRKPKVEKVVEEVVEESAQETGRSKRNKANALSEILKKEKLGSGKLSFPN